MKSVINLSHSRNEIKKYLNAAAMNFVAIGYHLKAIRDSEAYSKDGYESIWEFAQKEFGLSKSTTSRYISINDQFSVEGNSPSLQPGLEGLTSSKLIEMLTLSDEQRDKVTPDMTVKEIRGLKKAIDLKAEGQLPGQTCIYDHPEFLPDRKDESVAISQPASIPKPVPDYAEYVKSYVDYAGNDRVIHFMRICREYSSNSERGKAIQKLIAPYGYSGSSGGGYSTQFRSFAKGLKLQPKGKEELHMSYTQFAKALTESCNPWSSEYLQEELLSDIEKAQEPLQEDVAEPIFDETEVDLMAAEVILKELIFHTKEILEAFQDAWEESQPEILLKNKLMLMAYELLLTRWCGEV